MAGPQGTILPVGDVLVSVYIHHKWNPPPMSEEGEACLGMTKGSDVLNVRWRPAMERGDIE